MKLLLWLRALRAWNFYNWDSEVARKDDIVVIQDLPDLDDFNVGQMFMITSVNRTTGRITVQHD